jgi:hypothetical protein
MVKGIKEFFRKILLTFQKNKLRSNHEEIHIYDILPKTFGEGKRIREKLP